MLNLIPPAVARQSQTGRTYTISPRLGVIASHLMPVPETQQCLQNSYSSGNHQPQPKQTSYHRSSTKVSHPASGSQLFYRDTFRYFLMKFHTSPCIFI
ncbi:hypothetical protein TNIN_365821 [Trichonephila inaurata madagascariensis]|uniref:Uncharacterized protein n=1 Tax=Trichonephila inaurata madagascariensis TaxID=2747483 RepID=A0A8X6YHS6_9ARAC|nr:hypothetical protein TNIN_365821 [Trichonephila inaurata madagascariensis]